MLTSCFVTLLLLIDNVYSALDPTVIESTNLHIPDLLAYALGEVKDVNYGKGALGVVFNNSVSQSGIDQMDYLSGTSSEPKNYNDYLDIIAQDLSNAIFGRIGAITGIESARLVAQPEELHFTACGFIERYGYQCKDHEVVTEDGYVLSVQRIFGKEGKATTNLRKYPVLLGHGLLTSGRDWVLSGKPQSLAFELADNDVDVWIINHRCTDLSDNNIYMNKDNSQYYNYSFHEMGLYDLPATITYIKEVTQVDQIIHVGFSQGGAIFYAMFAEKPDYLTENVRLHIGLSPAVMLTHSRNLIAMAFSLGINNFQALTTYYQQSHHVNFLKPFIALFVNLGAFCYNIRNFAPAICPFVMSPIMDSNNLFVTDRAVLGRLLSTAMKVTTSKQILHFTQNSYYCGFYKYREETSAPLIPYDLTHAVTTEMHIFGSSDDHFVPLENMYALQGNMTHTFLHVHKLDQYYHENLVFDSSSHNNLRADFLDLIYTTSSYYRQ